MKTDHRHIFGLAGFAFVSIAPIGNSDAATFASTVVDYTPGSGASLTDPAAALGKPSAVVGLGTGFDSILNVFNPHYEPGQLVQVGEGGSLTLRLSHYAVANAAIPEIGVFANVAIIDADWPNGIAGGELSAEAGTFGIDSAEIEFSPDGELWASLGMIELDQPSNFYANLPTPSTLDVEGLTEADFGLSHSNSLADFAGQNWEGIKGLLRESAGGTWLDLEPTGLDRAGWVRFSVPDDGNPNTMLTIEIDAVAIEGRASGPSIPEPGTAAFLMIGFAMWWTGRRRR